MINEVGTKRQIRCPLCKKTDKFEESVFCPSCGAIVEMRYNEEEAKMCVRAYNSAIKEEEPKAKKAEYCSLINAFGFVIGYANHQRYYKIVPLLIKEYKSGR